MAAYLAMSHGRQTPSYKEVGTSVGIVKFIVLIFHYCTVTSCVLYRNATQHIAFFELEVNSCFLDIWKNSCYTEREIACILCSQLDMLDVVSMCAGQLSRMHHKSEQSDQQLLRYRVTLHTIYVAWISSISNQFMGHAHHPQGPAILTEAQSKAHRSMLFHCFSKLCIRIERVHSESTQLYFFRASKLHQPAKRKASMSRCA